MMSERQRKRLIQANAARIARCDGDIMEGDWVQAGGKGPVGYVRLVEGDLATIAWIGRHDFKGILDAVPVSLLARVDYPGEGK